MFDVIFLLSSKLQYFCDWREKWNTFRFSDQTFLISLASLFVWQYICCMSYVVSPSKPFENFARYSLQTCIMCFAYVKQNYDKWYFDEIHITSISVCVSKAKSRATIIVTIAMCAQTMPTIPTCHDSNTRSLQLKIKFHFCHSNTFCLFCL